MRLQLLCSPFAFRTCSYKAVDSTKTKPYDRVLPYDRSSQKLILFSEMCLNLLFGISWKLIAWKFLETIPKRKLSKKMYTSINFSQNSASPIQLNVWRHFEPLFALEAIYKFNVSLIYVGLYAKYGLPFLTHSKTWFVPWCLYNGILSDNCCVSESITYAIYHS